MLFSRGSLPTVCFKTMWYSTDSLHGTSGSSLNYDVLQSTRLLPAHTICLMDMRTLLLVYPVDWLVWLLVWLLVLLEMLVSGEHSTSLQHASKTWYMYRSPLFQCAANVSMAATGQTHSNLSFSWE